MKNHLIPLALFALTLLYACSTQDKEIDKGNFYQIGSKKWYIEFPENYVSYANMPDTVESTLICGKLMKAKIIIPLKLQKHDTLWQDPIPNSASVFLVPKKSMNRTKQDCVEQLIRSYSMFIEYGSGRDYRHKEKEVVIGGIKFMELENSILDSTGVFSHGDIHYVGIVAENWMEILVGFNTTKEREKLRSLILNSKFE